MKIGVYGLGRFGYFWAELLSNYCEVMAYSRNPERIVPAKVERVSEDELCKLPVIFFCNSISSFEPVIKQLAGQFNPGTLIIDTCSVKVHPVQVMHQYLPQEVNILATHPMFGPDSARQGIANLPIILCPLRERDCSRQLEEWSTFFKMIGLHVIMMTPEEHDQQAAFTQGITHYVGRVLADLGLKESPKATLGYKKLLEIIEQTCNDPWQLFIDLQRYNPYTEEMRKQLHASVEKIYNSCAC
jgi:prephenate dehydrogenase